MKEKKCAEEKKFLLAIKDNLQNALIFADWLMERDRNVEAAQWRAKAGESRIVYQVYDPVQKKVYAEYETVGGCNGRIARFFHKAFRERLIIRMMEYRLNHVADLPAKKLRLYDGQRIIGSQNEDASV